LGGACTPGPGCWRPGIGDRNWEQRAGFQVGNRRGPLGGRGLEAARRWGISSAGGPSTDLQVHRPAQCSGSGNVVPRGGRSRVGVIPASKEAGRGSFRPTPDGRGLAVFDVAVVGTWLGGGRDRKVDRRRAPSIRKPSSPLESRPPAGYRRGSLDWNRSPWPSDRGDQRVPKPG